MSIVLEIEVEFEVGTIVYLVTDIEQLPRIVVEQIVGDNYLAYVVMQGTIRSSHSDFELSRKRDVILTTTN